MATPSRFTTIHPTVTMLRTIYHSVFILCVCAMVDSKFEIDQIIGNEEHVVVTGISSRKVGIFGSPNIDIIEGNEVSGFEFCLLFEWQNNKLSNMYLNDCSVQTHETVMKEWIDQI